MSPSRSHGTTRLLAIRELRGSNLRAPVEGLRHLVELRCVPEGAAVLVDTDGTDRGYRRNHCFVGIGDLADAEVLERWPWHHQLYPGVGADIVMESIALIDLARGCNCRFSAVS